MSSNQATMRKSLDVEWDDYPIFLGDTSKKGHSSCTLLCAHTRLRSTNTWCADCSRMSTFLFHKLGARRELWTSHNGLRTSCQKTPLVSACFAQRNGLFVHRVNRASLPKTASSKSFGKKHLILFWGKIPRWLVTSMLMTQHCPDSENKLNTLLIAQNMSFWKLFKTSFSTSLSIIRSHHWWHQVMVWPTRVQNIRTLN